MLSAEMAVPLSQLSGGAMSTAREKSPDGIPLSQLGRAGIKDLLSHSEIASGAAHR
jgi:hypothetical protein